jgi:hypothetical protein
LVDGRIVFVIETPVFDTREAQSEVSFNSVRVSSERNP